MADHPSWQAGAPWGGSHSATLAEQGFSRSRTSRLLSPWQVQCGQLRQPHGLARLQGEWGRAETGLGDQGNPTGPRPWAGRRVGEGHLRLRPQILSGQG